MEAKEDIIIHIIVVGFHHKKGYQVEFTHPQWSTGDECPPAWSHLPSTAMPDGSHNYHQETVYFHLPPIDGSDTVYGVSCYRQIDSDRVVNRTEDMTRTSVQKSVIALSRLPLFGQIQVKLELITSAYFETGDFSKVDVLKDAFTNLNQCLSPDMLRTPQVFVGLSVRDLVLMFRHKLLVLFKLAVLERRVLLQHSPVSELCSALLALASLFPEMVQSGLTRCVLQPRPPSRRTSAVRSPDQESQPAAPAPAADSASDGGLRRASDAAADVVTGNSTFYRSNSSGSGGEGGGGATTTATAGALHPQLHRSQSDGATAAAAGRAARREAPRSSVFYDTAEAEEVEGEDAAAARTSTFYLGPGAAQEQEQQSVDARVERLLAAAEKMDDTQCGMPLRRFRKGHLCHPYLCLSDIHLLSDAEVLTFLAGATNVLYSHKRHLVDAYITMSPCSVELSAPLRRQLALSTEDLRLADLLVRAVTEPGPGTGSGSSSGAGSPADSPSTADGAGQQPLRGSDAWLRAVFRLYLYMMLRTSMLPDGSAEHALYNISYIAALKETPSYVKWADGQHLGVLEVNPGHPCSGQLSMADMRLRISQSFQSSERGRKVTQVAAMTGRAVGGALTVARGALTSWWSSLATPEEATPPAEPALDTANTAEPPAGPAEPAEPAEPNTSYHQGAPPTTESRPGRPAFRPAGPAEPAEPIASCHQAAPPTAERRPGRPAFEAAATGDGQALSAAPCP